MSSASSVADGPVRESWWSRREFENTKRTKWGGFLIWLLTWIDPSGVQPWRNLASSCARSCSMKEAKMLDSAWFQLSWEERINRVIHLAKEKQSYTNQCFNPTKLFMSKNNKPFYCNSYSFSLLYLGTKSILYFCCKLQILWRKPWSQSHKDIS